MTSPRYLEIASVMRFKILSGDWPVGMRLPPIATLKDDYHVGGLNTIRAAQKVLQDEGLLLARQGSGVYVISSGSPVGVAVDLAAIRDRLTAVLTSLPGHLKFSVLTGPEDYSVCVEALRLYIVIQTRRARASATITEDEAHAADRAARAASGLLNRLAHVYQWHSAQADREESRA